MASDPNIATSGQGASRYSIFLEGNTNKKNLPKSKSKLKDKKSEMIPREKKLETISREKKPESQLKTSQPSRTLIRRNSTLSK